MLHEVMNFMMFAALAGAVQMIAPDRWMPASIFAWQRGWSFARVALFTLLIFAAHLLMGLAVFGFFGRLFTVVPDEMLGAFSFIFLGAVGLIRVQRFDRIREILSRSRNSRRVLLTLLSLLGPSEMIVPILMKARLDDVSLPMVIVVFFAGTWAAGLAGVAVSKAYWNKPLVLPAAFEWCQSRAAIVPMSAGVLLGIALISLRTIV